MQKERFDIIGMTCSSCSSHVERAVKKLDGTKNVNVNLLQNSMLVEYDETVLKDNQIIKAVMDAGYGANIHEDKKVENRKTKKEELDNANEHIKSMKKRLIISVCFLIPLMYVAMHHMFYEWFGLPIPNIIKNFFDGPENGINFALTQLILLLPIVYVNKNYFEVRFQKVIQRHS